MYVKLTFRNARRSAGDYLLYVTTLTVLSALMMFSNQLAAASHQNGLQAASVPVLIALVTVALLYYINGHMLRRRAREFATYILLGMRKNRIAFVFFGESLLLGIAGLAVGMALGSLFFLAALSFLRAWFPIGGHMPAAYGTAIRDTVLYFMAIQAASLAGCVWKIRTTQIGGLMSESRKNQRLKAKPRPVFWTVFCVACLAADLVLVFIITGGGDILKLLGVNMIMFPLISGIWAFYKAAFHWLIWLRIHRRSELYQGNRLYFTGQLLSRITDNITLNTVLSVCLLFAALTFSAGLIMPNIPGDLFGRETGLWMSFAEVCMCVVFIAIYFSILAVRQVIETKENRRAFQMMAYLGQTDCKSVIKREIVLKYTFPALMCLLVLSLCVGPVNGFLNSFLPTGNLLLAAAGIFAGCFMILYAGYALVTYKMSVKYVG